MGELIRLGGTLANCDRCGVLLRVASSRRDDENPSWVPRLRLAAEPKGVCASCNVRIWFYVMRHQLEGTNLPAALALPHVSAHLGGIFAANNSDPDCLRDVDWSRVIADWDLPIPGVWKKLRAKGAE